MAEKPIKHIFNEGKENEFSFRMIHIPKGKFDMGAEGIDSDSLPVQKDIEIDEFFMAEVPVTQALWKAVMGEENNRSYFKGDLRPVEKVSWEDVQDFLKKLNESKDGEERTADDGKTYQLPTEARWEYAAKANEQKGREFSGSKNIKEVGWFRSNSHSETKPVKLKLPNAFGLYDMTGNVWEWCVDDWIDNLEDMPKDGRSRKKEKNNYFRSVRGGSWLDVPDGCRLAIRFRLNADGRNPVIGFRISRY